MGNPVMCKAKGVRVMRRLGRLNEDKIIEFVTEQAKALGGEIERTIRRKATVAFAISGCDLETLSDRVNQSLGHYAYPWLSWVRDGRTLVVG